MLACAFRAMLALPPASSFFFFFLPFPVVVLLGPSGAPLTLPPGWLPKGVVVVGREYSRKVHGAWRVLGRDYDGAVANAGPPWMLPHGPFPASNPPYGAPCPAFHAIHIFFFVVAVSTSRHSQTAITGRAGNQTRQIADRHSSRQRQDQG